MREFTVEIKQLPLGILFAPPSAHKNFITIIGVSNYSHGEQLGLSIGDILIGINGRSTFELSSFETLKLFNKQRAPFSATFRSFTKHIPMVRIQTDMKSGWKHKYKARKESNAIAIAPKLSKTQSCDIDDQQDLFAAGTGTPDIIKLDKLDIFDKIDPLDKIDSFDDYLSPAPSTMLLKSKSAPLGMIDPMSHSVISPKSTPNQIYSYLNFYDNHVDLFTKDLVNGYIRILDSRRATNEDSVGTQICTVLEIISIICAQYLFDNEIKFDYTKQSIPPPPGGWGLGNGGNHKLYDFTSTDSERVNGYDHGLATICKISSNGLKYGYHEWSIKITKCQSAIRQEIGVISNPDFDEYDIPTFEHGIKNTFEFGAMDNNK